MIIDSIKPDIKMVGADKDNVTILIAVLSGLVIASLLQLSITVFSKLKVPEKIEPEIKVSWLMPVQKKTNVKPDKPVSVKHRSSSNKNVVKKNKISKSIPPRKETYSPLAPKVAIKKKDKQTKTNRINEIINTSKFIKSNQSIPVPTPVFQLTDVPRFLHKEPLVYPESMRTLGNSGVVKLKILIDKYGVVRKVTILESAGEEFDQQAEIALLASTFIAAKVKEKPVAALLKLSIKFNLI